MKTLEQFATGYSPVMALKIGELSSAFSNLQFVRKKFTAAEAALADARQNENMFNVIDALGESRDQLVAKTEHLAARVAVTSAEKFFKKLMHEFIELGATMDDTVELKEILKEHHA